MVLQSQLDDDFKALDPSILMDSDNSTG